MKVEISNVKGDILRTAENVESIRYDGANLFHMVVGERTHLIPNSYFVSVIDSKEEKTVEVV